MGAFYHSEEPTHPKHYSECAIEPIDYIAENKLGFLEGNVVKYVTRHRQKNGAEDIHKAIYYLQEILKREYNGNDRQTD